MIVLTARYTLIKARMAGDDPSVRLNAGQHLLASASSGVITAFMTNPLWVVKTRMFTSSRQVDPLRAVPYRGVIDGLTRLAREDGVPLHLPTLWERCDPWT